MVQETGLVMANTSDDSIDVEDDVLEQVYQQHIDNNIEANGETRKLLHCVGKIMTKKCTPHDVLQPLLLANHNQGWAYSIVYIGGKNRANFDPAGLDLSSLSVEEAVLKIPELSIPGQQMVSGDWSKHVFARVSPWIDCDHPDPKIAQMSLEALKTEIEYAAYLKITTIVVQLRRGHNNHNLIKILPEFLKQKKININLLVPVDLQNVDQSYYADFPESQKTLFLETLASPTSPKDSWVWWYKLRSQVPLNNMMAPALHISHNLQQYIYDNPEGINRWAGENVRCLWFTRASFATERPLRLSQKAEECVQALMTNCGCASVVDADLNATGANNVINHLRNVWEGRYSGAEKILGHCSQLSCDYIDVVQIPLQPLADNLEMETYQVFEEDQVKYPMYEQATFCAIRDVHLKGGKPKLTMCVLGAGRGPLVVRALQALTRFYDGAFFDDFGKPEVDFYVVEKNPFAIIGLKHDVKVEYPLKFAKILCGDNALVKVHLFESDMRSWSVPSSEDGSADIVISELLGSFGCNELSPECLDSCKKVMGPHTISIPCEYTSYIGPLQAPKLFTLSRLWNKSVGAQYLLHSRMLTHDSNMQNFDNDAFSKQMQSLGYEQEKIVDAHPLDIPFIVMSSCTYAIDEPKTVFKFKHPNLDNEPHSREINLTFRARSKCDMMGFIGYFDAILYKMHDG